jgi:hypothetical protein
MENSDDYVGTTTEERTSTTEAANVLAGLAGIWRDWIKHDNADFFQEKFEYMVRDETISGHIKIVEMRELANRRESDEDSLVPEHFFAISTMAILEISAAFVIQAIREKENSQAAWIYLHDASHWLGIARGLTAGILAGRDSPSLAMSNLGRLGADAAHAENRAMKKSIYEWCDTNFSDYKSMDGAAGAVAGKVVPVAFRTARSWISDWKKQLPPTGTL